MPIRTKEYCRNTFLNSYDEYNGIFTWVCETVPIQDWEVNKEQEKINWDRSQPTPQALKLEVTIPELEAIYPTHSNIRYIIDVANSIPNINWLQVTGPQLSGNNLLVAPTEKITLTSYFQYLVSLANGQHTIVISIIALGTKGSQEVELERKTSTITLTISGSQNNQIPALDKSIYQISYLAKTKKLVGEIAGTITDNPQGKSIKITDNTEETTWISFSPNPASTSFEIKAYSEIKKNITVSCSAFLIENNTKISDFSVQIKYIEEASGFDVSPTSFFWNLSKTSIEEASGKVFITNFSDKNISVISFPDFILSAIINNNTLEIISKKGVDLTEKIYKGDVVLSDGLVNKTINISLDITSFVSSDFANEPYYFALDKNKIAVRKSSISSVKAIFKINAFYSGYEQNESISQAYQVLFWDEKASFDPGKEVHDFFLKLRKSKNFNTSYDAYQPAVVQVTIYELDAADNILKSYLLDSCKMVPGAKPKGFPIFTDHLMRRYYPSTKMALSYDSITQNPELKALQNFTEKEKDNTSLQIKTSLFPMENAPLGKIITAGKIQYIPFPETKVVHIFWENQNLAFDWFSCAYENSTVVDLEHVISDNYKNGQESKYSTTKNKTLQISTGWILHEEIDLITDVLSSNFCYVEIDDNSYRCLPIGKKNAMNSSVENILSMVLEFKILEDER